MGLPLPDDTKRHLIIGSTGSGKTVHGIHQLSMRDFDRKPWVIVDYKRDENIARIPYATVIDHETQLPDGPGIYIVRPDIDDHIEEFLREVHQRGDIGLFIDEAYELGRNNRAYRRILTQGRSKRIPVIALSQRSIWLDTFMLSESEFISVFNLNFKKDRERMEEYVPFPFTKHEIPDYYSIYYYVKERGTVHKVRPSPPVEQIFAHIAHRMRNYRQKV